MNKLIFIFLVMLTSFPPLVSAQGNKTGWFFTPEASVMLLDQHQGRTVGFQAGVSILKQRLHAGIFYYSRSGGINSYEVSYTLPENRTYKGQSTLNFGVDHAFSGMFLAPQFRLGKVNLDVPLMVGFLGAGFYLKGDDRLTPDGRRVSEWEDELLGDADAGGGLGLEAGLRARVQLTEGIESGIGIHYTQTIGYNSTLGGTNYYNAPRLSLFFLFGN